MGVQESCVFSDDSQLPIHLLRYILLWLWLPCQLVPFYPYHRSLIFTLLSQNECRLLTRHCATALLRNVFLLLRCLSRHTLHRPRLLHV